MTYSIELSGSGPRRQVKAFTGRVVRGLGDQRGLRDPDHDPAVWCSEPVDFVREWRCFVRNGRIVHVRPYAGDWRGAYDPSVLERAIAAFTSAPAGCALDFGVTADGRTLLVEGNDGYALGAYGLFPIDYAKLLSARWCQVVGVPDPGDF